MKPPKAKLISEYKERINYSAKTIGELAQMLELYSPTIIVLNGKHYRVEELEGNNKPVSK